MNIGRKNTIVLTSFESLCQLTFLQPPTWRQSVRISGSCVPPIQSVTPKVALEPGLLTFEKVSLRESLKTRAAQFFFQVYFSQCAIGFISHNLPTNAQCVVCKVHFFRATEQPQTYLKLSKMLFHLTYICPSLFECAGR